MDLIAWLEDLAAAYRIEPSEMTTRRYLKSLERWRLSPKQWDRLSDCAVLRCAKFPSIADLYDIARELQYRDQISANSEWIASLCHDWSCNQTDDHLCDSGYLGHEEIS